MSFRFTTAGESHGPGLVAIVEGLPAGLELDRERLDREMARRQLGHGRGGRMKIESDSVEIRSGVRHGRTLGSSGRRPGREPRLRQLGGADEPLAGGRRGRGGPHARGPGHADLAGLLKFGHSDVRNVLERASARETAARVAAGALAKELLRAFGVSVHSHVVQIGSVRAPERDDLGAEDFADVDSSPVRCLDPDASEAMVAEIDRLRKANESLGGIFEVRAFGLVPGLGSHTELGGAPGRPPGPGAGLDPGRQGSLGGGGLGGGRQARLRVARRDLLVRGAGLAPGDQSRRRRRGRDVEWRAALRARGAEADLDPDQAAALGRHRDQGARRGASRANRLDRGPGGRRGGRGDDRPGAGPLLPREVRRRPHRRRAGRAGRLQGADRVATRRGAGRGPRRAGGPAAGDRLHRLHGRRQDGRRQRRARRRLGGDRGRRAARGRARDADRPVLRPSRRGGVPEPRVRRR